MVCSDLDRDEPQEGQFNGQSSSVTTQKTFMLQRIRQAAEKENDDDNLLAGIVEIDEISIGGSVKGMQRAFGLIQVYNSKKIKCQHHLVPTLPYRHSSVRRTRKHDLSNPATFGFNPRNPLIRIIRDSDTAGRRGRARTGGWADEQGTHGWRSGGVGNAHGAAGRGWARTGFRGDPLRFGSPICF